MPQSKVNKSKVIVEEINAREKTFLEKMKNELQWLENLSMKFHLSPEEITKRIDDFQLDCKCNDKSHDSLSDAKYHFTNWLRIQLSYETKNVKNATDKQKHENRRRGTDVSAKSPEDYKTSF